MKRQTGNLLVFKTVQTFTELRHVMYTWERVLAGFG